MEAIVEIEDTIRTTVPLPLRAGVTVGPVILIDGDDYIGHAVNLASRLCVEAKPHEVLAPAAAVSALLVNTHAEPMGRREIPGVGEPIEVVRLTAHD
jgi:class 3 adenylate cyclase